MVGMNERDYDNLRFLLAIDGDGMSRWVAQASDDDIEYARVLLEMARLDLIDVAIDKGHSLQQSSLLLSKFQGKP